MVYMVYYINRRILHSGSKALDKAESRNARDCRILTFLWSFGPLLGDTGFILSTVMTGLPSRVLVSYGQNSLDVAF